MPQSVSAAGAWPGFVACGSSSPRGRRCSGDCAPAGKKPEDQLFDTIDAGDLNKRLKDLMDGLSVKVPQLLHSALICSCAYLGFSLDTLPPKSHKAQQPPSETLELTHLGNRLRSRLRCKSLSRQLCPTLPHQKKLG